MLVIQRNVDQSLTINLEPLIDLAATAAGDLGDVVRASIAAAMEGYPARIYVSNVAVRPGRRVRIGVEAPKIVTVHRTEVQKRIDNESTGN